MKHKLAKILSAIFTLAFFISACGAGQENELRSPFAFYEKSQFQERFKAFKKEIIEKLDNENQGYDFNEISLGDIESSDLDYTVLYSFDIKGGLPAKLNISLSNENGAETFTFSLEIIRDNVKACKLKLDKYPYALEIVNSLSDLHLSKKQMQSLINSGSKGLVKAFERDNQALYRKKSKAFESSQDFERIASYSVYYDSAKEPPVFLESFNFEGLLSQGNFD